MTSSSSCLPSFPPPVTSTEAVEYESVLTPLSLCPLPRASQLVSGCPSRPDASASVVSSLHPSAVTSSSLSAKSAFLPPTKEAIVHKTIATW